MEPLQSRLHSGPPNSSLTFSPTNNVVPVQDCLHNCFPVLGEGQLSVLEVGYGGDRTPGRVKLWSASSRRQRLCVPGDLVPSDLEYSVLSYLQHIQKPLIHQITMAGLTPGPVHLGFRGWLKCEYVVGTCPKRCWCPIHDNLGPRPNIP